MSQQRADAEDSLPERLVAYLDGELEPEETRRIEELLTTDAEARRTLQRLDRTWHLLESLDASSVGEQFTQTTLEMVTVAAADEVQRQQAEAPRRRRRRWLIAAGGLAAAGLAGFLAAALLADALDPNKQLIHDLPVLENLDQYSQVKDIDFLRMLSREQIFAEESSDGK
jgi:anti-sigma factor RsiW